jgi:hypothetical protein
MNKKKLEDLKFFFNSKYIVYENFNLINFLKIKIAEIENKNFSICNIINCTNENCLFFFG